VSIKLDKAKIGKALWDLNVGIYARNYNGGCCYYNGYIIALGNPIPNVRSAIQTMQAYGPPLTIEHYGYVVNPETYKIFYPMVSMEPAWAASVDFGAIIVKLDDTTYMLRTYNGVATTDTTLVGQDWTTERHFKLEWTTTAVTLYIDGAQVASHTTNLPSPPQCPFLEIAHKTTAPTTYSKLYIKYPEGFVIS